jgi:DNA-binding transcriptional ArsR family regulator
MESVSGIIAEPNRRAILSLQGSSRQSVGEIEPQLHMPQPTASKHLRVLRPAGFVESTVDGQRRLYPLNHFRSGTPGWLHCVASGPLTWMLSNAISTEWINQHPRKGRRGQGEEDDRS